MIWNFLERSGTFYKLENKIALSLKYGKINAIAMEYTRPKVYRFGFRDKQKDKDKKGKKRQEKKRKKIHKKK